jgi:cell division protein FtsZ
MQMTVNEPVQVVPVTEVNQSGVIRYSLDDYMEKENELATSKPVVEEVKEEPVAAELNFTMKRTDVVSVPPQSQYDEISPVEMTIEETLRMRADERKRKMKEFNYKFNNSATRVNELEREPAYKRMGVDINAASHDNYKSRMSLGTDSNDDIQLRSNNSFLHDNVD